MKIFADNHLTPDSLRLISVVLFFWAGCFLYQKYKIVLGGQRMRGTVVDVKTLLNTNSRGRWRRRYEYTVEVCGRRLPVLGEPLYLKRMRAGETCTVYLNPRRPQYVVLANDFIPELFGAALIILGILLW